MYVCVNVILMPYLVIDTPTLVAGEVMSEGTARYNCRICFSLWQLLAGKNRLLLLDTPGQKEYKKLRMMSFRNTKVFVLLFATDSKNSFDNVFDNWFKEIREHDPEGKIPFFVVGTKTDARDAQIKAGATGILTTADCKKRAESIGAAAYIEVSAKSAATTNNGKAAVEEVFAKALHLATTPYVPKKNGGGCMIL